MAEIVSSSSCLMVSSRWPRRGLDFLSASISAIDVLKMIASKSEQMNDTPNVRTMARMSQNMTAVYPSRVRGEYKLRRTDNWEKSLAAPPAAPRSHRHE